MLAANIENKNKQVNLCGFLPFLQHPVFIEQNVSANQDS